MATRKVTITLEEHDLGRAYFKGMEMALARVDTGDLRDAAADFRRCAVGFVELYRRHGPYENDVLLPAIGAVLTPADDAIVVALIRAHAPADVTPDISLIQILERELGIT
jgi:hemerythrin-like domain-containing protein